MNDHTFDQDRAGIRFITGAFILMGFVTLGLGLGLALEVPGPGTVIGAGAGFAVIGLVRALRGPA